MTLDTMIVLLDDLLSYDLDNFKRRDAHTVTPEEKTAQINYGLRTISRYISQFDHSIVLTLTADDPTVNLRDSDEVSRKVFEVKEVIINGSRLYRPNGRPGLWNMSDVQRLIPQWRTADAGIPRVAWQTGTTLNLYQKPSAAAVSGGNNFIAGTYMAADLVYGENAEPDIPEELHEAVVRVAAAFASDPTLSENEAMQRSARYEQRAFAAAQEIRIRNYKQMAAFGSFPGNATPNFTYYG